MSGSCARTYYYWKSQLETYSIIKPKSTKPKNNKNKLKNKKIIKRIIEIRKLYGYGKFKIKKQFTGQFFGEYLYSPFFYILFRSHRYCTFFSLKKAGIPYNLIN